MTKLTTRQVRYVVALGLTLASSGIVVAIHRQSARTAISAHGLLHTAIANQFMEPVQGSHPLENPFFAGAELPYYWVFHWTAARVANQTGVHVLRAFELLILAALAIVWFSAAALGGRLYGGILPGAALGFLALAGTNALGVPALLWKLTVGGAMFPADGPNYLWGIVHPVMGMARIHDPFALYGPLVNFFLNVTSRPLALALLLLVAAMLWRWLDEERVSWLAGLVLTTAAATAFSPIIGLPAGAAIAGALVLVAVTSWWSGPHPGLGRRMIAAALAIGVGLLLASPTFLHLFGQAGGGIELGPRGSTFMGVAASILPLALVAGIGIWRTGEPVRRSYLAVVTIAATVLLIAAVITKIRASNDTNFFHAGAFLMAVPAAAMFRPWTSRLQSAARLSLVLVFAPTASLVLLAYTRRPPVALAFLDGRLERVPASSPRAQLYRWVREATAPDAVFVIDPRPPLEMAMGNVLEFPALTGRSLFVAQAESYMVAPYTDADRRHGIAVRLLSGDPLDPADRTYVDRLSRPVYLVSREADVADRMARLQDLFGPPRFRSGPVAAFALDPDRAALSTDGGGGGGQP